MGGYRGIREATGEVMARKRGDNEGGWACHFFTNQAPFGYTLTVLTVLITQFLEFI